MIKKPMSFTTPLVYLLVIVVWSAYRYFFHLPVWFEETLIKGIIFLLPLFLWPLKTKSQLVGLDITRRRFFPSVYFGIAVGMALGFSGQIGNLIRHGGLTFNSYQLSSGSIGAFIILALITAFWEQLLFSGYFLNRLKTSFSGEVTPVLLTGLGFSLIHLPVLIFVQHQSFAAALFSFILLLSLGVSCAILRLRLHNLIAPIMIQAFWGITIFLFR